MIFTVHVRAAKGLKQSYTGEATLVPDTILTLIQKNVKKKKEVTYAFRPYIPWIGEVESNALPFDHIKLKKSDRNKKGRLFVFLSRV